MSKNINIAAHVKRYEHTDLPDVVALVEGLNDLIDRRRVSDITKLREQLASLERGEIPKEETPPTPKRTRGGKKSIAESTESA